MSLMYSGVISRSRSVSAIAGVMQFTSTPLVASSFPRDFVSAITPAFAAEYGPAFALPSLPATEAMFTIRPPPRARMCGTTDRQHRNTPVRSTSITRRQSLIGYSQTGTVGPFTPALFTSTSMRPMAARVFRVAVSTESGSLTSMRSTCAAG